MPAMFWTVFRLEGRLLRTDRAVHLVLGLFCLLVAYASLTGARHVRAREAHQQAAVHDEATRVQALRGGLATGKSVALGGEDRAAPADPFQVGRHLSRAVALPIGPLASIAVTTDADVVEVTTHSRHTGGSGEASITSPVRLAAGTFDLTFVFVYLMPLVIIALTYDLLAGERERGTLALVLSQPVSLTSFVMAKALHRAAILLGAVLLLGLVAWWASRPAGEHDETPAHLLLYAGALVAYAAFWFTAAVAVNSWGRTAAGNALTLVGLWLLLVIIVPGLVRVGLDRAYPPPSRVELANLSREAARKAESTASALEGEHGEKDEDAYETSVRRSLQAQQELERQIRPVIGEFDEQVRRQQELVTGLQYLSPAIAVHEALSDIAGASVHRRRHFDAQLDSFQATWREFLHEKIEARQPLTALDYARFPLFRYELEPTPELSGRVGAALAGLALATLGLLLVSLLGLRRIGRLV